MVHLRPWLDHVRHPVPPASGEAVTRTFGVTDDGERVRLASYPMPAGVSADTMLALVRRLTTISHANLVPILGAEVREDQLWVYSEDDGGRSLADLLGDHPLTAPQAVAVGLATLSGLQELQRAGLAHGALDPSAVQVASYGQVRLTGYGVRPLTLSEATSTWPDPRRDVTAAGLVLCAALGIDPQRAPGHASTHLERTLPGLAATALTIASGSGGRSASTALMMLTDGAGRLASRSRVYLSIAELGRLIEGGLALPSSPAIAGAVDSVMTPPAASAALGEATAAEPSALISSSPLVEDGPARPAAEAIAAVDSPAEISPRSTGGSVAQPALAPLRTRALAAPRVVTRPPTPWRKPAMLAAAGVLVLLIALGALLQRPRTPATRTARAATGGVLAQPAVRPVPATAPAQAPAVPAPDAVAAAVPSSPEGTVRSFYNLVLQHSNEQAAALWTERMKENYPPQANINERFAGTTSLTINQARTTMGAGAATVAMDLSEVTYGVSYRWVGTWRLVSVSGSWLLDQPDFQSA